MPRKNKVSDDWIKEAMEPIIGKAPSGFRYVKASRKRGTRTIDTLEVRFPNGKLNVSSDPVGADLELTVWFTPKKP